MFNEKFFIFFALILSIFLIASSVSAEEIITDDENNLDEVNENELSNEDNSLDVIEVEEEDNIAEINEDSNILSESASSENGNQVSIPDVTVSEEKEVIVKVNTNHVCDYDIIYTITLCDSKDTFITGFDELLPFGNHTSQVSLGYLKPGDYVLSYADDDGLACTSNIHVLAHKVIGKITANNFSAYYKAGKNVNVKTVDKYNNKPISLKVKLVFKNTSNGKTYTYYLTTNSKGVGKFKVNLGRGTYKLTVSSANSKISSNKAFATVKVNRLPIKITVPNYSSFYKSGKKLKVKAINKSSNKGISVKLKFVYKKAKAKAKVVYVTTNKYGNVKINIPVGIGNYKLTVTPASSNFKASKVSRKVNVNRYVVFKYGSYAAKLHYSKVIKLKEIYDMYEDYDGYEYYFAKSNKYKIQCCQL